MTPSRLIIGLAFATAIGGAANAAAARTLDTVVSFSVLADVVKEVGGDHVHVRSLVPANGDPHEYEPTPDDAKALKAADVTFISGEGLEHWFERLAKAAGYKAKPVVVSRGVKTHVMQEDGKRVTDPHVWNDPANVRIWVSHITEALVAADPEDADAFRANATRYDRTLKELDAYAHGKLDGIAKRDRKVLTSHDAFGYLGAAYGVTFLSPLGVSTETEASAADVAKLIDQIKREKVTVYFLENSNDPRLIRQIAEATGAQPGGELYPESLSKADGPAPTYAAMFRYNIDTIASAFAKK